MWMIKFRFGSNKGSCISDDVFYNRDTSSAKPGAVKNIWKEGDGKKIMRVLKSHCTVVS